MEKYKQYIKISVTEMAEWYEGFNMDKVSISVGDVKNGSPKKGDMIARNPETPETKWLVSEKYFKENFALKNYEINVATLPPDLDIQSFVEKWNKQQPKMFTNTATKYSIFYEQLTLRILDRIVMKLLVNDTMMHINGGNEITIKCSSLFKDVLMKDILKNILVNPIEKLKKENSFLYKGNTFTFDVIDKDTKSEFAKVEHGDTHILINKL